MTRAQLFDDQQARHSTKDGYTVFDNPYNTQYATHEECYANELGYSWRYSDKHRHGAEAHWHDYRHDGSYRLEGCHVQQDNYLYSEENEHTHRGAHGYAAVRRVPAGSQGFIWPTYSAPWDEPAYTIHEKPRYTSHTEPVFSRRVHGRPERRSIPRQGESYIGPWLFPINTSTTRPSTASCSCVEDGSKRCRKEKRKKEACQGKRGMDDKWNAHYRFSDFGGTVHYRESYVDARGGYGQHAVEHQDGQGFWEWWRE
ncbi:uncharacterized protein F5Z01DRAFT_639153 [Emericellopsis atlantica]|uniref:Uncharacterized protein n=1 Tax=Emericellopsis atlantica TaxID=2614577 RepID=A0A9P7ZHG2_9HYPO|nr:uncharacterized protein F5Z01DRAFT_639153 [Emericellopsis atlantica]KAG9251553.1 hypothetical protein F5Z01DRAFT_639153 [Emericellopsis atlantica]